ncbi:MAG: hypothetical protein ACT4TC_19395 [Myxococcaceae bacterium]
MSCYWDNDIVHKLAALDLVSEACTTIGVALADVLVLPTAQYKFLLKKPELGARKYGEAVHRRIVAALAVARVTPNAPDAADEKMLADVPGIDAGEAVLFSIVAKSNIRLVTGDKKAIEALATAPQCTGHVRMLSGRVLCFEQLVLLLIDKFGFEVIQAKVIPAVSCDTSLRAAFGSGINATEANVRAALNSYLLNLRGKAGGLLAS